MINWGILGRKDGAPFLPTWPFFPMLSSTLSVPVTKKKLEIGEEFSVPYR